MRSKTSLGVMSNVDSIKDVQLNKLQLNIMKYKNIQNKLLNTQFLNERKDHKNKVHIRSGSTFGSHLKVDKFD